MPIPLSGIFGDGHYRHIKVNKADERMLYGRFWTSCFARKDGRPFRAGCRKLAIAIFTRNQRLNRFDCPGASLQLEHGLRLLCERGFPCAAGDIDGHA